MPAAIDIRPAARRDIDAIARVEAECFPDSPYTLRQLRSYFRTGGAVFLAAWYGPSLAGYVAGVADRRFRPPAARLDSLAVLPAFRRRGLGALLLQAFEHRAKRLGCEASVLQVSVRNAAAKRLYERSGYGTRACLPDYYGPGHDAVQMAKLTPAAECDI